MRRIQTIKRLAKFNTQHDLTSSHNNLCACPKHMSSPCHRDENPSCKRTWAHPTPRDLVKLEYLRSACCICIPSFTSASSGIPHKHALDEYLQTKKTRIDHWRAVWPMAPFTLSLKPWHCWPKTVDSWTTKTGQTEMVVWDHHPGCCFRQKWNHQTDSTVVFFPLYHHSRCLSYICYIHSITCHDMSFQINN